MSLARLGTGKRTGWFSCYLRYSIALFYSIYLPVYLLKEAHVFCVRMWPMSGPGREFSFLKKSSTKIIILDRAIALFGVEEGVQNLRFAKWCYPTYSWKKIISKNLKWNKHSCFLLCYYLTFLHRSYASHHNQAPSNITRAAYTPYTSTLNPRRSTDDTFKNPTLPSKSKPGETKQHCQRTTPDISDLRLQLRPQIIPKWLCVNPARGPLVSPCDKIAYNRPWKRSVRDVVMFKVWR